MTCSQCGFNIREAEEFYAKQNQAIQRELSESNEYARRLNLKITDLCKERDELKAINHSANLDWSDDDTRLREMCLKAGIPQSLIDGDTYYAPHIVGLGELLVQKIEAVTKERDDWKNIASEMLGALQMCMQCLKAPPGSAGFISDGELCKMKHWRDIVADAMEKFPGCTVDREVYRALDLPKRQRDAALRKKRLT